MPKTDRDPRVQELFDKLSSSERDALADAVFDKSDRLGMVEAPPADENPFKTVAYIHLTTTSPSLSDVSHSVNSMCELCTREAVIEGPLTVNNRLYPHADLCEVCFHPPELHPAIDDDELEALYDDEQLGHA